MLTNELFGVLKRTMAGIDVNDDTLAVDALTRAGIGGHYPGDPPTLDPLREERLDSFLLKPKTREQYVEQGASGMVQRAGDRARRILAEHRPRGLGPEIAQEFEDIIRLARKKLG
jgi:trimethylamine--corrinoid protein Co-methyltransferase